MISANHCSTHAMLNTVLDWADNSVTAWQERIAERFVKKDTNTTVQVSEDTMSMHPDRQANLAAMWTTVPVAIVALGAIAINTATGWNVIALYFVRIFGAVLTALIPIILGAMALKRGTAKREKALLAIFVSVIAMVSAIIFNAPSG